jgi:hypothetical protein
MYGKNPTPDQIASHKESSGCGLSTKRKGHAPKCTGLHQKRRDLFQEQSRRNRIV